MIDLAASGLLSVVLLFVVHAAVADDICEQAVSGQKQLLWGDLHVHTAWSFDAYVFGAVATPQDAYAFARGQPLRLPDGEMASIDRPLDFAAVTDHADTFDVMYLCSDPGYRDDAWCSTLREGRRKREGRRLFTDLLLPILSTTPGTPVPLCETPGVDCRSASASQWRRVQEAAEEANDPCRFTALIGYEWSASPGGRHWHRNVIFRSADVPTEAFDYIRYPRVADLWAALERTCRPEDGCQALAIPHNINWADGGSFDVAGVATDELALRARYERLAEIHQEKGSSECLPADRDDPGADCAFERLTGNFAQQHVSGEGSDTPDVAWARMRSTYYRGLLARGLAASAESDDGLNPLMLGAVGSTDNHLGTPGRVDEHGYWGSMSMIWATDEQRLGQAAYNPGGLVAVWAEQNTRGAVFDALHRREAYATSGPRISLRFGAASADACSHAEPPLSTVMGGELPRGTPPRFVVLAGQDRTALAAVDIVKATLVDGAPVESVTRIAEFPAGEASACIVWQDPAFDPEAPAYWYTRVIEQPTPRWDRYLCERLESCSAESAATRTVAERAWSSPIWYYP
ncbi:MAG: DUF3604 domain-containing protein [Pseudomonadales bacterium]|nr:DUF3604 domain-containing protein [Pseudomonadales bacterium]